jgi:hypothetical protein
MYFVWRRSLSTKRQLLALSTDKLGYRFFEPEDTPPGTPSLEASLAATARQI